MNVNAHRKCGLALAYGIGSTGVVVWKVPQLFGDKTNKVFTFAHVSLSAGCFRFQSVAANPDSRFVFCLLIIPGQHTEASVQDLLANAPW